MKKLYLIAMVIQALCTGGVAQASDLNEMDAPYCSSNLDCGNTGVCVDNHCSNIPDEHHCNFDTDCGAGNKCSYGSCTAGGGGCTFDSECGYQGVCVSGHCGSRPIGGCSFNAQCAYGQVCTGGVCVHG